MDQLVIVLGSPRSGTTWVQQLLSEHPAVASQPETGLFPLYLTPLLRTWERDQPPHAGLAKSLDREEFTDCCRQFGALVLDRIARRDPLSHVLVEKTPANAIVWRDIHRLFPEAWFVHAVRDPRDVVASLRAAGRSWGRNWAPSSVAEAARVWVHHTGAALEIPRHTANHVVVRYERLLEPGSTELRSLFEALGIATDDAWCRDTLHKLSFAELSKRKDVGPTAFLRKGRAGGWRTDLTTSELRVVEHVAGGLMDELGYARALPSGRRAPVGWQLRDSLVRLSRRANRLAIRSARRVLGQPSPRPRS